MRSLVDELKHLSILLVQDRRQRVNTTKSLRRLRCLFNRAPDCSLLSKLSFNIAKRQYLFSVVMANVLLCSAIKRKIW